MIRSLVRVRARMRDLATAWTARRVSPGDRGDVPGWVLITVMTAGLVSGLWIVAGPALVDLFQSSLSSVTGKK